MLTHDMDRTKFRLGVWLNLKWIYLNLPADLIACLIHWTVMEHWGQASHLGGSGDERASPS